MEPYQYFGLAAPPFEGRPDPRFFCGVPSQREALATLQFAAHTGKACSLALGESGSGKTLLGRLLAQSVTQRMRVLWVDGIGQPGGQTEVTVYPVGTAESPDAVGRQSVEESSLAAWIRTGLPAAQATLVIFDNADGLPPHSWEDILSLVTREARAPKPVSVALLGLPSLADQLGWPELIRLRRRIFRTCQLARLTCDEVAGYIRHRLDAAGANGAEVFAASAIELVHRYSGGNPALVNHICDNALVDAFADDRKLIDAPHVVASVHAISGGVPKPQSLPRPPMARLPMVIAPRTHDECPAPPGLQVIGESLDFPDISGAAAMLSVQATTVHGSRAEPVSAARDPCDGPGACTSMTPPRAPTTNLEDVARRAAQAAAAVRIEQVDRGDTYAAPVALDGDAELRQIQGRVSYVLLDGRLRALELRLSDALSRLRDARSWRALSPGPMPTEPDPPTSEIESAGTDSGSSAPQREGRMPSVPVDAAAQATEMLADADDPQAQTPARVGPP